MFYDRDADGLPGRWLEMVRHTLGTLGPKVLASRMVGDYVQRLYLPAAASGTAMNGPGYEGARELAAWNARIRERWSSVRVDHVESSGIGDSPQVGETLHVRAFLSLGDLDPSDVLVEVLHGRVNDADELTGTAAQRLEHTDTYEDGRHRFAGDLTLRRTGPFGYTVRVLPRHEGLASAAETGLVVNA